jgi:hypothetical protein
VPVGSVKRKDGTEHAFDFARFLRLASTDPNLANELKTVWLSGALLTLGDMLAKNGYFDRAPEFELVRHLRNGIAHGNHFRIDNPGQLQSLPAHNRYAWVRSDTKAEFAIVPSLHGTSVLFDFMGPGDILDLLMAVGLYLIRMGNGDPLRP